MLTQVNRSITIIYIIARVVIRINKKPDLLIFLVFQLIGYTETSEWKKK